VMQRITLRRHRMYAAVQSKLEQIRGVWRFRWTTMLVAWIVCLIGWLVVLAPPDTYGAWAQVHIDPRTPLSQYTKDIGLSPSTCLPRAGRSPRRWRKRAF